MDRASDTSGWPQTGANQHPSATGAELQKRIIPRWNTIIKLPATQEHKTAAGVIIKNLRLRCLYISMAAGAAPIYAIGSLCIPKATETNQKGGGFLGSFVAADISLKSFGFYAGLWTTKNPTSSPLLTRLCI